MKSIDIDKFIISEIIVSVYLLSILMNTTRYNLLLKKIGLTPEEIEIYLYLNKVGVQTVKQISKETSINRTTTYRYLELLKEKNLIEWIIGSRGKSVRTTPSESLELLLTEKKVELDKVEQLLPPLLKQLRQDHPIESLATQVRYYEKEKGIRQMIWNSLDTNETLRSYTPLGRREVIDPKFEDEFELEWAKRKLTDRVITNETRIRYIQEELVPSYNRTLSIRIIPAQKFYITNDIAIYNNILTIASLEKSNLVGVEIENEEIAKTQKSIFDIVWEVAKPFR